MKKTLVLLATIATMVACQKDLETVEGNSVTEKTAIEREISSQVGEKYNSLSDKTILSYMKKLKAVITKKTSDKSCNGSTSNWDYVGIGHIACGGPSKYIAYKKDMHNLAGFLRLVDLYSDLSAELDSRSHLIGACAITPPPTGVECVNGNVELVYSDSDKPLSLTDKMDIEYSSIQKYLAEAGCGSNLGSVAVGSKACGGPSHYLAYNKDMKHVDRFLSSVERYTSLEEQYNKENMVIGTCNVTPAPKKVVCKGGKPTLVY